MDLSVAIPTCCRERDLAEALTSLLSQKRRPKEVIIIDDGELADEFVNRQAKAFKAAGIGLVYYRKDHHREAKGSSESKNKAIALAKNKVVVIIDDDVVLLPACLSNLMKVWEQNIGNSKLLGVGAIADNSREKHMFEDFFHRIFGLSSKNSWDVTQVGFQVWDNRVTNRTVGYYMSGYTASFKRDLALKVPFLCLGVGRTALEDVDMCFRAKMKGYHFIVEPSARVIHKQSTTSKDSECLTGFKEGYNRKILFRRNCSKRLDTCFCFGGPALDGSCGSSSWVILPRDWE